MRRYNIPDIPFTAIQEEGEEEEKEEEEGFVQDGDLPKILREPTTIHANASGKIIPGRVTFDESNRAFHEMSPEEIANDHRPPYAWTTKPEEVTRVKAWIERRYGLLAKVAFDNARKFLEVYAAYRNQELNALRIDGATNRNAFNRETNENLRWLERTQLGLQRAQRPTPKTTPEKKPPPSTISEAEESLRRGELFTPRPPQRVEPATFPSSEEESDIFSLLLQGHDERRIHRMAERERLTNVATWMEQPELLGLQGLRSEVYGHCESAYVDLKMRLRGYENVPDFNTFVNTDVVEVRNLFARLAATMAIITDFFTAPVTALDKNKIRLDGLIRSYYQQLEEWKYDNLARVFVKQSKADVRENYERSLALAAPRQTMSKWRRLY